MLIKIKKLGLAAFIKTCSELDPNGATTFLDYKEGHFIFESNTEVARWRIKYMNDICSRFDKNLMELREFLS